MQTAPKALNDRGTVVGGLRPSVDALPAFVCVAVHEIQELPSPSGTAWALPLGINTPGQIVGYASEATMQTRHAYLWEPAPSNLPAKSPFEWTAHALKDEGATSSEATAINTSGDIVGIRWRSDGVPHACMWHQGACLDLESTRSWHPTGINSKGEVVGWGMDASNHVHLYHFAPIGPLNSLTVGQKTVGRKSVAHTKEPAQTGVSGALTDLGNGYQIAINDNGEMAGDYLGRDGHYHACFWRPNAKSTRQGYIREDLPDLPGSMESHAIALNSRGQIVGRVSLSLIDRAKDKTKDKTKDQYRNKGHNDQKNSENRPGEPIPVLWEKGQAVDLRTRLNARLEGVLEEAIGINGSGQILCTGRQGIWGRAVVLTPIEGKYRIQIF